MAERQRDTRVAGFQAWQCLRRQSHPQSFPNRDKQPALCIFPSPYTKFLPARLMQRLEGAIKPCMLDRKPELEILGVDSQLRHLYVEYIYECASPEGTVTGYNAKIRVT